MAENQENKNQSTNPDTNEENIENNDVGNEPEDKYETSKPTSAVSTTEEKSGLVGAEETKSINEEDEAALSGQKEQQDGAETGNNLEKDAEATNKADIERMENEGASSSNNANDQNTTTESPKADEGGVSSSDKANDQNATPTENPQANEDSQEDEKKKKKRFGCCGKEEE